jgi:hypothetical protein
MMLRVVILIIFISQCLALRRSSTLIRNCRAFDLKMTQNFDPFGFLKDIRLEVSSKPSLLPSNLLSGYIITASLIALPLLMGLLLSTSSVQADDTVNIFDPSKFQPVCPASDGVYQVLKLTANGLVGRENVDEYGPLIASVLLRIRLELCVLESFLYEAVIPFVSKKGLSWILPLHETVETFLAGTIFAIASNFILLGSTKILSVLLIYADVVTGMPTRFIGSTLKKTNTNNIPEKMGGVLSLYGDLIGAVKSFVENADTFVGRYLVIFTTFYITFKFFHFKVFNDIIPF